MDPAEIFAAKNRAIADSHRVVRASMALLVIDM